MSVVIAHNPEKDSINWKQYLRLGGVNSSIFERGITGYTRYKRTTLKTFKDFRLYIHYFNSKTEVRTRYKSSRFFLNFNKYYTFSTIKYEKNTMLNGNLNYNYNQGLGFFILKNKTNSMTFEIGPSFDNSDYLNSQIRTSYLKNSYSIDIILKKFKTKVEIDYLYEISKNLQKEANSKLQLMAEISFFINNSNSITIGIFQDYLNKTIENRSLSVSYSTSKAINLKM